jgi:hypothetical protein
MAVSVGAGWSIGPGVVLGGAPIPIATGSAVFNGSNYLTVPDNTVFGQTSTPWTVECFAYPNDTGQRYIYMQNTSGFLGLVYDGDSGTFGIDQQGVGFAAVSAASYPINNWYHVAMTYNSTSNNVNLWVEGSLEGTWSASGLTASANITNIGCYVAGIQPYKGYISNLRVVKGVQVYTGSYNVPSTPLTVTQGADVGVSAIGAGQCELLLNTVNGANFLKDNSTNNFTVTNIGSATSSALNPF